MARTKGATADKLWGDAIRMVAASDTELDGQKVKRLRKVAHKLFDLAEEGDVTAIKEIGDRMDGKAKQATEVSGPDGASIPAVIFAAATGDNAEG